VQPEFDIKLNQNLWGLVAAYGALGVAEHWSLRWLFRLSLGVSIFMSVSVVFTVAFYTWNYCREKWRGK